MNGFRQHTAKAAIGIGASLVFLIIPLVGVYFDPDRKYIWLWVLLLFSTMPAVGWGAAHLAMPRGYPSAGGCAVCIIGYVVAGVLGTTFRTQWSLASACCLSFYCPSFSCWLFPVKTGAITAGGTTISTLLT